MQSRGHFLIAKRCAVLTKPQFNVPSGRIGQHKAGSQGHDLPNLSNTCQERIHGYFPKSDPPNNVPQNTIILILRPKRAPLISETSTC